MRNLEEIRDRLTTALGYLNAFDHQSDYSEEERSDLDAARQASIDALADAMERVGRVLDSFGDN